MKKGRDTDEEHLKTDVAVIGAGGAGMAAAIAARDSGADVILLEKRRMPGGNTALAQALFAAESPAQKRLSIDAPKDVLFKMAMDYAHWKINPRIVRAFIDKSGDTVRWLEEMGLEKIDNIPPFYPRQSIRTFHYPNGGGVAVVKVLLSACEKRGVRLLRGTPAKKILINSRGEITGVQAVNGDGKQLAITAASVIIATGGFGGNKRLLKKYFPEYAAIRSLGIPLAGDGFLMAREAGAAMEGGALQLEGPIIEGGRQGRSVYEEPDLVWVNNRGERFADESLAFNHFESVNAMLRQPHMVSYSLFDKSLTQTLVKRIEDGYVRYRGLGPRPENAGPPDFLEDLKTEVRRGTVKITDSWDDMARWIGAAPDVLKTTIVEYNSYCDCGHDAIFAKEARYLVPLRTPPFYAIRCQPIFLTAIGGIKIDDRMQVINISDAPIPGLYASGNDTGGWEPDTYNAVLSGHAFAFALSSGRIAGENAAQYASSKSVNL